MPSGRVQVTLEGIIKGQDIEATCRISAVRVTHPSGIDSRLTHLKILNTSESLPDGNYEVVVDGKSEPVKLQNGLWLSGIVG